MKEWETAIFVNDELYLTIISEGGTATRVRTELYSPNQVAVNFTPIPISRVKAALKKQPASARTRPFQGIEPAVTAYFRVQPKHPADFPPTDLLSCVYPQNEGKTRSLISISQSGIQNVNPAHGLIME